MGRHSTKKTTVYSVAAWWPKDDEYGGTRFFDTKEEAIVVLEQLKKLGFNHADVWRTTRQLVATYDKTSATVTG